ncbi:hypothetical protein AB6A40_001789 [Gnathostoma spinigerum]|uniref:GYF domain-containing protein n=1 Tax=Gnathostoma spinigerum TaxID=75299 RepID=A0ABD6E521_9BILA
MDTTRSAVIDSPKWYYQGEDQQVYGPYPCTDMQKWWKAGYFSDSMLMRTESEERFHSLAEWMRYCNGQSPFATVCQSFDQLVSLNLHFSQLLLAPPHHRVPPSAGPFVMIPPPAGASPAVPLAGFSPSQGAHSFIPYPASHLVLPSHASLVHPFSQPPSEPVDELPSSASNTPDDSEAGWNSSNSIRNVSTLALCEKSSSTEDAPWLHVQDSATDPIEKRLFTSSAVQTEPMKISFDEACRIITEIIGSPVQIT